MTLSSPRIKSGLVSIVLPAKNEEAAIGRTLRALPISTLKAMGFACEVVVLDGNSHDGTARIAREWGAIVLTDKKPGKGRALRNAREHLKGDFVVMLDADGTYSADAIPRVVARLAFNDADVVMGRRVPQRGSMSVVHEAGNSLLSVGASMLYARACPDLCTGLWGFRADALRALPLQSRGFELEAELFAMSSRLGLRIQQVRTDYLPRNGHAKLSGGPDGLRIGWFLVRSRFRPARPQRGRVRPSLSMPAEPTLDATPANRPAPQEGAA